MKLRFQHAQGRAVAEYKDDEATLDEIIEILKNPDVIKVTVVKETPAQYFKRAKKEGLF